MALLTFASPLLATRAALEVDARTPAGTLGLVSATPAVSDDPRGLAPKFARCVLYVLNRLEDLGHPSNLYEARRSDALQQHYYAQGRTRPGARVTNAPSAGYSFHGYGLAVDIIHRVHRWAAPMTYWTLLAKTAEEVGLVAGARWKMRDYPHIQWGTGAAGTAIRLSPSDHARAVLRQYPGEAGVQRIWDEVRAA